MKISRAVAVVCFVLISISAATYFCFQKDMAQPPLLTIESGAKSLAATPDLSLVFAAYSQVGNGSKKPAGTIKMWSLANVVAAPGWQWVSPGYAANEIAVSPAGKVLAAACTDGKTRLWKRPSGKFSGAIAALRNGNQAGASSVAFSPDGISLAIATPLQHNAKDRDPNIKSSVRVFDARTLKLLNVFNFQWHVRKIRFSPDSKNLLVSYTGHSSNTVFGRFGYCAGEDIAGVSLMKISDWSELGTGGASYFSVKPFAAAQLLRNKASNIARHEGEDLSALAKPERGEVLKVELSSGGDRIAVGYRGLLEIYDPATRELKDTISNGNAGSFPDFLEFSRDGKRLLLVESGDVRLFFVN